MVTDADFDWKDRSDCQAGPVCGDAAHSRKVLMGMLRVAHGGSFNDVPDDLRSATRIGYLPTDERAYCGFRLARTIAAK